MFRTILFILIFLAVLLPYYAAYPATSPHVRPKDQPIVLIHSGKYPICGPYKLEGDEIIKFNANEIKLICGDPEVYTWSTIPRSQALYNIRNFLQDRGYFYPEFEEKDGVTTVHMGVKTKVSEIIPTGSYPESLKIGRRRGAKNNALTPSLISSLDEWATAQLANSGYPCADVGVTADASSGKVTLHIEPGQDEVFPEISQEPMKEIDARILKRYYAFKEGNPYNQKLLTLTSRRTETNGIVQSTYFVPQCTPEGITVQQKSSAGRPRLFIFGVGADTEEIVKGKISWKHSRLGKKASSIKVEATGSYRKQALTTTSKWYIFNKPTRWHLEPNISFERRYERHYDYISADIGLFPAVTWDGQYIRMILNFGPEVTLKRTFRGAHPGITKFLSGVANLSIISHDYEFYDYDPKNGFTLNFSANLNSRDALSSVTAQQMEMSGEWLLNLGNLDPPLIILGLRGGAGTTITEKGSPYFNNLPPDFLYYLGGSRDLRGFKREELPPTYRGALTAAAASVEARLVNTLPFGLQPIAFVDIGALGSNSLGLDYPVYWSPGFGARLYSFIGVFRATVAHGFMIGNNDPGNNKAKHWQFYFSYGEEF